MLYLCGPLRDEYFEQNVDIENKKNIVLYNPKKGIEFTKKIIEACEKKEKDYQFIAIQNMTPEQIIDIMKQAKVYMDFGYFPGPERIPREAVMLKCNVVSSNIGSAANKIDVLIPEKYKFPLNEKEIDNIIEIFDELMDNYESHIGEYDDYRKKVIGQKKIFVDNILYLKNHFEL